MVLNPLYCIRNWRASVASETLTGVTQSKIGDVYLLASERSERSPFVLKHTTSLFIYLASERSERDIISG